MSNTSCPFLTIYDNALSNCNTLSLTFLSGLVEICFNWPINSFTFKWYILKLEIIYNNKLYLLFGQKGSLNHVSMKYTHLYSLSHLNISPFQNDLRETMF